MPTPSSHGDNESLALNSTCPDEQGASSGRIHPPPPYENNEPVRNLSHTEAASDSAAEVGIGEGQTTAARNGSTAPRSTSAMSPSMQPTTGEAPTAPTPDDPMFLNGGEQDDDANKQTDSDDDMTDHPTADIVQETRDERASPPSRAARTSSRQAGSRDMARFYIPDNEIWEPIGVSQSLQRRLDIAGPSVSDSPSPTSMDGEKAEDPAAADDLGWNDKYLPGYMGCDPTSLRVIPASPSTYLRPGSRFVGTQQSERQVYDVQVEIKHVDLRESFLCGYLRIQGLTEDHPTLTTYFEGEIIGSKYGFTTKHKSWGASDRIDMSHWAKFVAFRQFARQAKKGNFVIKEYLQKENIFMRWKEHFLVPDHRVRTINGASFEGFYYICFNQVEGVVHGIYFHSKSEKFQQLELKHVEDKGCMSALEFR